MYKYQIDSNIDKLSDIYKNQLIHWNHTHKRVTIATKALL